MPTSRTPKSNDPAPTVKRGKGRPEKPFEELTERGRRTRISRMNAKAAKQGGAAALKAVPPAPPPEPQPPQQLPQQLPDPDNLPPMAIREEIDVHEFMRRAMLGQINPTARQMIAARALMALELKDPGRGAGGGSSAEPGKKEQQAGEARNVAQGSRFSPTPPPTRLRVA